MVNVKNVLSLVSQHFRGDEKEEEVAQDDIQMSLIIVDMLSSNKSPYSYKDLDFAMPEFDVDDAYNEEEGRKRYYESYQPKYDQARMEKNALDTSESCCDCLQQAAMV